MVHLMDGYFEYSLTERMKHLSSGGTLPSDHNNGVNLKELSVGFAVNDAD